MTQDEFMFRAIELAKNGLGSVSPNPQVGCVIVRNGIIIGEGWHRQYGGPHAEANAINQVPDPEWLRESEMYVTLEPCSHQGKTPPCADLIISKEIKIVYIAYIDPNPVVNGKGIRMMEEAGIKVITGMLKEQARAVNKRYITAITAGRPYIILKWAQTHDGFIARESYDSKWISGELSRQLVHKWRSEEDAVMVGFNTVKYDNPILNVRDWKGRDPVRLIIDRENELSGNLNIFDRKQKTYIFNNVKDHCEKNLEYVKITAPDFIPAVLKKIAESGIHSVMVEGGAATLNELIRSGLWDEARVFVSDKIFHRGIRAPLLQDHELTGKESVDDDMLYTYEPQRT